MIVRNNAELDKLNSDSMVEGFSGLLKRAVYGVVINIKQQVLTTHNELLELRRCSRILKTRPNHIIHIISPRGSAHSSFYEKALIHLGVPSVQIRPTFATADEAVPEGLWLVVAEN